MTKARESVYDEAAQWIRKAGSIAVFSGAGVSAESGIATFRDPGGIWDRFDPLEVGTPDGMLRTLAHTPERAISFMRDVLETLRRAGPNRGHRALGELERTGKVRGVITQNVDGLHQEGGSSNVIELHGNSFRLRCAGAAPPVLRVWSTLVIVAPRNKLSSAAKRRPAKQHPACPCRNPGQKSARGHRFALNQ